MDVDTIPFGVDFRQYINDALKKTDFLLVIIGPRSNRTALLRTPCGLTGARVRKWQARGIKVVSDRYERRGDSHGCGRYKRLAPFLEGCFKPRSNRNA